MASTAANSTFVPSCSSIFVPSQIVSTSSREAYAVYLVAATNQMAPENQSSRGGVAEAQHAGGMTILKSRRQRPPRADGTVPSNSKINYENWGRPRFRAPSGMEHAPIASAGDLLAGRERRGAALEAGYEDADVTASSHPGGVAENQQTDA